MIAFTSVAHREDHPCIVIPLGQTSVWISQRTAGHRRAQYASEALVGASFLAPNSQCLIQASPTASVKLALQRD